MMLKKKIIALLPVLLISTYAAQASGRADSRAEEKEILEYVDFRDTPEILSFEDGTAPARAMKKSSLKISGLHSKLGENSLLWKWSRAGASIEIPVPVPYLHENPNPKETSVSTFVFWVYSAVPLSGSLRFSFMKGDRECCGFDYKLGFTGWRGAWVAFDRDMEGKPEEGMDRIVITAPQDMKKGELFFDGIIASAFEDVRHHTADWQAPFINSETTSHWLVLNRSWNLSLDIPVGKSISDKELADMKTVRDRFIALVSEGKKAKSPEALRRTFNSYGIRTNDDGTVTGKPVFFTRYGETYINLGIRDASAQFSDNGQLLRPANDFLLDLAIAYMNAEDPGWKNEVAEMYVEMTRHLLDQGFAAGSALGTLHHLGYSMRNFYTAPVIMKEVLEEAGLARRVQQAMEWFSGVGEVKKAPETPGMDIDAFNTSLMGRAASIIMLENGPYKEAYFKAFSRWIDNGFRYTDGLQPCFKRDGSVQHHRKAYPAYATGGFDGAVNAVWMLHGTGFAISEESHSILKRALLEMRFYCNLKSFPLAMSGRHPDGKGALIPSQYALLADAGTPDGLEEIDRDLASAYLRLNGSSGKWGEKFTSAGISPETSPVGCHVYPFNCSLSYRQDDWLVTIAGHSRYLWSSEIYNGANHYGRYLTHGSMEIIADGDPVSSIGSGYQVNGYDWCHIPGTTAAAIPLEAMKADVRNVDEFSGYEEMLLSDEWFAGGVSHKGTTGAYAMILHEHDKYNGSLRAHKSFFAFGNRIVALGSDLQNMLPGSDLHTTLFQNSLPAPDPSASVAIEDILSATTTVNGGKISVTNFDETYDGEMTVLQDRFGNAWFVKDARVEVSRGLQHSFHEETDAPTEGYFEKAWICHGDIVGKGVIAGDKYMKDSYEYMTVIHASDEEIGKYSSELPYTVLRCDSKAHIIHDNETGITACAVFEELKRQDTAEDNRNGQASGLIEASPCMLMYSFTGGILTLSASNPDLGLYKGESDEVFDENGKRTERSVYGRKWIDNPCAPVTIRVVIAGLWTLSGSAPGNVTVSHEGGNTVLTFKTAEARTEEITLKGNGMKG